MLQIKTYLEKSNIEGIGLFAAEDIKKGALIWKFSPKMDKLVSPKKLERLTPPEQDFIKTYSALSKNTGNYIVYGDNTRFINHSSDPNTEAKQMEGEPETPSFAKKDIKKGEEITIDYRSIDKNDAISTKTYLSGNS